MSEQRLVDAYILGIKDNSDNAELLQSIVTRITNGDTSLLELVRSLGQYLGSDEATRRNHGTQMLSDVLYELPDSAISARATEMLVQFFSARLSDATCVPQILRAILAVIRLSTFTDNMAIDVSTALFREVHLQSFQHATRESAYKMLDSIIDSNPKAVTRIGGDFVLGYAQMLDGEKDPRSLVIAFGIVLKLVDIIDIKKYTEELFDVVFCYFPITFKHREGDPSEITADSLKIALRKCITCSPHFGELAVGPLVNKTSASSVSAKVDAYETLVAATSVFSPSLFKPYMEELVDQIKNDVFMAANDDVIDTALKTLEAVYAVTSKPNPNEVDEDGDAQLSFDDMAVDSTPLDDLLKESIIQLNNDEIKNPEEVGKILRAIARSSHYNCLIVNDAILPVIIDRLSITEALTIRRQLIDVLNYVISASCDLQTPTSSLESMKNDLLSIYKPESAVPLDKEYSFLHMVRLKGITLLILLREFLDENEMALSLQTIATASIEQNEDENVNKEATHLLSQLSQAVPDSVRDHVLPMYFNSITPGGQCVSLNKTSRLLNALGVIGTSNSVVFPVVVESLVALVVGNRLPALQLIGTLTTARKLIEARMASAGNDAELHIALLDKLVVPLSQWAYRYTQHPGNSLPPDAIYEIAKCAVVVFSKLSSDLQEKYLIDWFSGYQSVLSTAASSATQLQGNIEQTLPIFSAIVCSCNSQTKLPVNDMNSFLAELTHTAIISSDTAASAPAFRRDASLEIIASIINKTKDNAARKTLVGSVMDTVNVNSPSIDESTLAHLHQWVARALVSCNDNAGYISVRWLLECIERNGPGAHQAAEGFDVILGEHSWSVTKETHGIFKLLFRQRFYNTVLPEITNRFKKTNKTNSSVKENLLVVLGSVVKCTPKTILMTTGIEEVIPLLLAAIRLTKNSLKAASIHTVAMIMMESPDALKNDLVSSIIPLLIKSLVYSPESHSYNSVNVRKSALDSLALIPEKYAYSIVHPVRSDILCATSAARDDRKRLVRQDAVKCYNKWLKFGAL